VLKIIILLIIVHFNIITKKPFDSFKDWTHKDRAYVRLLYLKLIGENLSSDEPILFNSDLYTIFTNKDGHGKKGSIIAILKDTITIDLIPILHKIPLGKQNLVEEVTPDMAESTNLSAKKCFRKKTKVTIGFMFKN
jgi:transposase